MDKSDEQVREEFDETVTMSCKEFEECLQTEESQQVGQKDGGGESKGHESGCGIVEVLDKDQSDYTEDDLDHSSSDFQAYFACVCDDGYKDRNKK